MPKGRILIVDDEPAIAESLDEMLQGWGYETAVASDGAAGLAAVEEFLPSVVVSDVYMPRLDGFGLLREVRELHPDTAVILLTGRSIGLLEQSCNMARLLQPATVILEDVDLIAEERTR